MQQTSGSLANTAPRIAVCVVTYNSAGLIEDLVSSLADGGAGTDWSLVFADNASSDHTIAELRRVARDATVVELGANRGYAAGINAAIRAAGEQDARRFTRDDDVRADEMRDHLEHRRLSGAGPAGQHDSAQSMGSRTVADRATVGASGRDHE